MRNRRWEERASEFDAGNSHMPMLDPYQRMLSAWRPLWQNKIRSIGGHRELLFSLAELQEIIAAWVQPEHRPGA